MFARPVSGRPATVRPAGLAAAALVMLGASLSPCAAQNPAVPQYQGMQPELVRGVEDGVATGRPKLRHVYLAAPGVLGLVVDAQNVWREPLQRYDPQPGDRVRRRRPQPYGTQGHVFYWNRTLFRHDQILGEVVGPKEDHYSPPNRLRGEKLNVEWAQKPENYAIASGDDPAYAQAAAPSAVFRKTKPETLEWTDRGIQESSQRHELFLLLPRPLTPGKRYTVTFRDAPQLEGPVDFLFDDGRLRTEALQVNQAGYHPRQAEKVARLSMWLGDGGGADLAAVAAGEFRLLDDRDGREVFRGPITLRRAAVPDKEMAPEKTADPGDELPQAVYQLDFSTFTKPGVYRVAVPGLGASFPFRVDEDVWRDAARMAAHGYFNQRSGLALGPPHSKFPRPRDLHPADGFKVRRTDPALFFDKVRFPEGSTKGGNPFERIQASILEDTEVPEAWGGWHDAADYDRSVTPQNHLRAVHAMLDLIAANPAYFEKLALNLPESGNAIPDLVDEALWCLELFRRIQQPDGGVPGAVESIEHPSEPSWLLGQPTAITPPTTRSGVLYAAAAARMALALKPYDAALAEAYRDSAQRAMRWADRTAPQKNELAAFWMFRLTGEDQWHERFHASLGEPGAAQDRPRLNASGGGPWGFVEYAFLPDGTGDAALREECRQALLRTADADAETIARRTWHLGPERFNWDKRLGQPWPLIAAHRLTGDAKYLRALERLGQFALGLNPTNASYTTGTGARQVVIFNIEAHYLGAAYPEGITAYGPAPRNVWRGAAIEAKLHAHGLFPEWRHWPWAESSFNVREANLNEYVAGGNMANQLLLRAYLAQALATAR